MGMIFLFEVMKMFQNYGDRIMVKDYGVSCIPL